MTASFFAKLGNINNSFLLAIFFILLFLIIILLIPVEKRARRKRAKTGELKDWQKIAESLDRAVKSLHAEIARYQEKEKEWQKQLTIEKVKTKKVQEKLSQERTWQQKEQETTDKKGNEYKQLKDDLIKLQESNAKEHAQRLKLERELNEVSIRVEEANDLRRRAEVDAAHSKDKIEELKIELAKVKGENLELKKKNEDVSWIAKTEYKKLEKQLEEKEKELERIRRELI